MAYLVIYSANAAPVKQKLEGSVTVGRDKECGIWINDLRMSREHCRLERKGNDWFAVDLQSRNGTRVGGKRIGLIKLSDNLTVEVGDTRMVFRQGSIAARRPADPFEAAQLRTPSAEPLVDSGQSTLSGTRFATRVPSPNASSAPASGPNQPLLAFSRPPARPIVPGKQPAVPSRPQSPRESKEETGWFKAIVSKLKKQ